MKLFEVLGLHFVIIYENDQQDDKEAKDKLAGSPGENGGG
jgi:hypothetical protein